MDYKKELIDLIALCVGEVKAELTIDTLPDDRKTFLTNRLEVLRAKYNLIKSQVPPTIELVYKEMDFIHEEVGAITALLFEHRERVFDLDSYLGLKEKIEAKEEINTKVYVLVSAIVYGKLNIDNILRNNPTLSLNQKVIAYLKELSEILIAYKSILYSVSAEMQTLREALYVKHPELRQRPL